MRLTQGNFHLFAAQAYDNPGCVDEDEFREDLDRFKQLKRSFTHYENTGRINTHAVLNRIILLFNVFDTRACTSMVMYRFRDHLSTVKPFLVYLGHWPKDETDVWLDPRIVDELRELESCLRP